VNMNDEFIFYSRGSSRLVSGAREPSEKGNFFILPFRYFWKIAEISSRLDI